MKHLIPFALLLACATAAHAGDTERYGAPVPEGDTVSISAAIDDFDAHADKAQRFSGRITEVCQRMGCWMMLEDNGKAARVASGNHAFFIPKDSSGSAVVYGVLTRKEQAPGQVEHLSGDSGKGVAAQPVEYRITATGVEIAS